MKNIKTARGRILDMGALAAKNEETRAVSNLNMNARGDIIDSRGKVEIPREKIQKEFYKNNVPGAKEDVSIKDDETPVEKKTTVEQPKPASKKEPKAAPKPAPAPKPEPKPAPEPKPELKEEPKVTEVSRTARTRDDGTQYYEVEYSDGSMEDINM